MIESLDPIDDYRALVMPRSAIAEHIARLCAGTFADLCVVYHRTSDAPMAFATRLPGQFPSLRSAAFDEHYPERAHESGLVSYIYQPLISEGETIGGVLLGTDAPYVPIRRAHAETVASILASAFSQEAQLTHHYRVSERLQRAMLPATLVAVEGIAFDAAYNPASGEAEVGGDWYDAFEIGNGTIGISVGDVTGHGLEAAVTMSEIRSAIRAAAATHTSPGTLLNAVGSMVSSQGLGMASALVGIYDPRTFLLRYACGGHPPPVLVGPAGTAYPLPGGGILLGLGIPAASAERTITLAPGAACFFYTDGLTENDRDPLEGEERLLATLESMARRGSLSARELHACIIGDASSLDDCATLALRRLEADLAPRERYTFGAVASMARLARDCVRNYADRAGAGDGVMTDVIVAAGEAVANAIEHGNRSSEATFSVDLAVEEGQLIVEVTSAGHWRNAAPHVDRGRGIGIMRSCANYFEVSSTSERTLVTLAFPLASPSRI